MVTRSKEVAQACAAMRTFLRGRGFQTPKTRAGRLDEADAILDLIYCQYGGDRQRAVLNVYELGACGYFADKWRDDRHLSRENVRDNVETALRAQARRRAS